MATQWLQLRSDLEGLVLSENSKAYTTLSNLGINVPRTLVAIGGAQKTKYLDSLQRQSGTLPSPVERDDLENATRAPTIFLRQLSTSSVVFECEMHSDSTIPRIKAGPVSRHIAHHQIHRKSYPQTAITNDIICQILFLFASVIGIFVEDFRDLVEVAELVASWASHLHLAPNTQRPAVLLFSAVSLNLASFKHLVVSKLSQLLRGSVKRPVDVLQNAFEDFQILNPFQSQIFSAVEVSFARRQQSGLDFSSRHLREFLQLAIPMFSRGETYDCYRASRIRRPLPTNHATHIENFLQASSNRLIKNLVVLIASYLELDAYPPGMHFFRPDATFDNFYREAIAKIPYAKIAVPVNDIRKQFIRLATARQFSSSNLAHMELIHSYQDVFANCHSEATCLLCVADTPLQARLLCGHRLCGDCIIRSGQRLEDDTSRFNFQYCPLCNKRLGESIITLQPPTAGTRVLMLSGSKKCAFGVLKFLKSLQTLIGLSHFSLRDHFDVALGDGIGSYFVQALFINKWTLAVCSYHVSRIKYLHLTNNTAEYGPGLAWNLFDTERLDSARVALIPNGRIDDEWSKAKISPDIVLRYDGQPYTTGHLMLLASQMFCYLFYLELVSVLDGHAMVIVRCRLPSGPPLLDLLGRLRLKTTQLAFRADDERFSKEELVTPSTFKKCCKGERFGRLLLISVASTSSRLDVRVTDSQGDLQCISKCPYELKQLVSDQRMDCVFGRKDHQPTQNYEHADYQQVATEQLRDLQGTLQMMEGWWM